MNSFWNSIILLLYYSLNINLSLSLPTSTSFFNNNIDSLTISKKNYNSHDSSSRSSNLISPKVDQIIYRKKSFRLTFEDKVTVATATQVALANSTGLYILKTDLPLHQGKLDVQIMVPDWVGDGIYDFVFSENTGKLNGRGHYSDIIIFTIFVEKKIKNWSLTPLEQQKLKEAEAENNNNNREGRNEDLIEFSPNQISSFFDKREPHLPIFQKPLIDQVVLLGHHLDIVFIDGELISKNVRFVLRNLKEQTSNSNSNSNSNTSVDSENGIGNDLILFGKNSSSSGFFDFQNFKVFARVFIPRLLPNGTYHLVAQELKGKSEDVKSIKIQLKTPNYFKSNISNQEEEEIEESKNQKRSKINNKNEDSNLVNESISDSPISVSLDDFENKHREDKLECEDYDNNNNNNNDHHGHKKDLMIDQDKSKFKTKGVQVQSPSIIEPYAYQDIPIGSKFNCKVQDPTATKEIVQFYLRSAFGQEFFLGQTKFVKGIASQTVTCPKGVKFDTYSLIVKENLIKKPKVFLQVISTPILITHPLKESEPSAKKEEEEMTEGQRDERKEKMVMIQKRKEEASSAQLLSPGHNQIIPPGGKFSCDFEDGSSNAVSVRFVLRYEDDIDDMIVGSAPIKAGRGTTTCQVPSNFVSGTYMFVAQEQLSNNLDGYQDMRSTMVSISSGKGRIQLDESQFRKRDGLDSIKPSQKFKSDHDHQLNLAGDTGLSSILLEPTSRQTIHPGQTFQVKIKDNDLPNFGSIRFILKTYEEYQSDEEHQEFHQLGVFNLDDDVEDGQIVLENVKCPDFVVQIKKSNSQMKYEDYLMNVIYVNEVVKLPLNFVQNS